jgi:glycosyltransferase involved in cell wall biosynthesis
MTRIALVCSEPLRPCMGGIGIRYVEFARHLSAAGLEVALLSPGAPEVTRPLVPEEVEVRRFSAGRLRRQLSGCRGAVAQGPLADQLLRKLPRLPVAIDLYDPWLVENLHYAETLGPEPYRRDHASWMLQLARGDLFLCSSLEQRLYYLGLLTALGRIRPERSAGDPEFRDLVAQVPFGVPARLPPHEPYLPPAQVGRRRLLFGGLYDWYDPMPLLEALERLDRPEWELILLASPNPETTPQERMREVEEWCRARGPGWWGGRVRQLGWAPAERRFDLLRDVDLLVSTFRPGLETRLSWRARFLDALAAGCPVVISEGGAVSRLIREWNAGWVVPPGDSEALAGVLVEVLGDGEERERRRHRGLEEIRAYHWQRVLEPLLAFCREPRRDGGKGAFGVFRNRGWRAGRRRAP